MIWGGLFSSSELGSRTVAIFSGAGFHLEVALISAGIQTRNMKRARNLRISELLKSKNKTADADEKGRADQRKTDSITVKWPKTGQQSATAKRARRIKKMSFFTSRTGRNLNRLNKMGVLRKRRIAYLEDENGIFLDQEQLLQKTIPQKNDNDVDSEPEIILMGVKYLHRKLLQSISRERELLRAQKCSRKKKRIRKMEPQRKNAKIQDFFCQAPSFNTPSDRRVSVNDIAYLNSIMSSHKQNKLNYNQMRPISTVLSNQSSLNESKLLSSGKFWIEGKQKTSMHTFNTNLSTIAGKIWSRKDSSQGKRDDAQKESVGSMFMESPYLRKA